MKVLTQKPERKFVRDVIGESSTTYAPIRFAIDDRQQQVTVQVGHFIGHSSIDQIERAEHDRPSNGLEGVRRYRVCKGSQFGTDFASLMLSQCKLEC